MFDKQDGPDEEVLELLASPRRLHLLNYLLDRGGKARLRELSRDIVASETDTAPEELDSGEIKRVYVSLYQTHVPVLQEHGVIEYDDTERVVSLDDRAGEVVAILEHQGEKRRRWAVYYTVVGLILVAFVLVYASSLVSIPAAVLAVITVGAAVTLLVLATVHYYEARSPSTRTHSILSDTV
jgi:hypothetical protein